MGVMIPPLPLFPLSLPMHHYGINPLMSVGIYTLKGKCVYLCMHVLIWNKFLQDKKPRMNLVIVNKGTSGEDLMKEKLPRIQKDIKMR
jgi:hypothetical protein